MICKISSQLKVTNDNVINITLTLYCIVYFLLFLCLILKRAQDFVEVLIELVQVKELKM